ncbi:hypothetical protein EE612_022125, partial [Oryza sativa]
LFVLRFYNSHTLRPSIFAVLRSRCQNTTTTACIYQSYILHQLLSLSLSHTHTQTSAAMLPVLILFGLLFSLQRNFPACSATNNGSTLMAGQVLTGGNKLISSNSKFALGFFQTGSSKQGGQVNDLV